MREAGVPVKRIANHLGRRNSSLRTFIASAGRRRPRALARHQSLFVPTRGALRKELDACLRTGRAMPPAKAYTKGGVGQGRIRDMVMISERPAEVADRAVPGHWEGDLIFGKKMTSIGTLV